jgi:hypothetical protein
VIEGYNTRLIPTEEGSQINKLRGRRKTQKVRERVQNCVVREDELLAV